MSKPIEELTIKEIRELKSQLANKLKKVVMIELAKFEAEHGIRARVDVSVERYPLKTDTGEIISYNCEAEADIEFIGEQI